MVRIKEVEGHFQAFGMILWERADKFSSLRDF